MSVRERGRLRTRSPRGPRPGHPTAVYGRVLDGEHVWLAVRDAEELTLRRPDGETLAVPSEAGRDGGHRVAVARFAVAAALADDDRRDLRLPLLAGSGREARPVAHAAHRRPGPMLPAPPTRDGRWRWSVAEHRGEVVLERHPVDRRIAVLGFAEHPDGVLVRLATDGTTTAADLVGEDGGAVVELAVSGGELVVPADLDVLAPGETVRLEVGGVPVGRRDNLLDAPHPGTLLPPLPGDLELRWGGAGRLAVHRRSERAT